MDQENSDYGYFSLFTFHIKIYIVICKDEIKSYVALHKFHDQQVAVRFRNIFQGPFSVTVKCYVRLSPQISAKLKIKLFHCVKSFQIRSFFLIRILSAVFSPNTGKYGPEITPYLDIFRAVFRTWDCLMLDRLY